MADEVKNKPQCSWIDGVGSTVSIDTAGEIVDLAGIDTSSLVGGPYNFEHKSDLPAQIVGKILECKKIFSEKDCENDRHKYYWDKIKTPYLYVMGRLFDDKKDSSKEVAALFIDDAEHPDEHPMVGFSIEGSKVDKKGIIVTKSIARKITVTNCPANKQCVAELIPGPQEKVKDPDSIFKSEPSFTIELLGKSEQLAKAISPVPGSKHPTSLQAKPTNKAPSTGMKYGPMESKPKDMGKEIGKTKSGKSVMSHAKPTDYKDFSPQEHQEAANIHMGHAEEGKGVPGASHFDTAKRHMAVAGRGERQGAQVQAARQEAIKKPDLNVKKSEKLKKDVDMSTPPPEPNKANAAAMQAGALSGATSPSQAWSNIKSGLGFGKKEKSKEKLEKGISMGMMGGGLPVESTDKKNKRGLFNPDVDKVGGTRTTMVGGMGMSRSEKKGKLKKALSAGSGMADPGNLVQGAALGKESVDKKMKKFEDPLKSTVAGDRIKRAAGYKERGDKLSHTIAMEGAKEAHKEKLSNIKAAPKPKLGKSEWLTRAEQEYKTWGKREEFEAFMAKSMPHLTRGEIRAIGQTLALSKSMEAERKLKKMMPPRANLNSFVEKKEKK